CDVWMSGLVVRLTVASCIAAPPVPRTVSDTLPVGVASVVRTVNERGVAAETRNGAAGSVVAPAGRPSMSTVTLPVNPLPGTIETVAAPLVLPSVAVRFVGVTASAKSGGGVEEPPPPQADRPSATTQTEKRSAIPGMTQNSSCGTCSVRVVMAPDRVQSVGC